MCMSQWTAFAKLQKEAEEPRGPEARRHPRFVASSCNCEKGAVSDFSATGLRITYSKCQKFEVGDMVDLELYSLKGKHTCVAEVMWISKKSRKQFEVGFKFADPDSAKQMRLFEVGFDPLNQGELDRPKFSGR